jgi:hypothetical protein
MKCCKRTRVKVLLLTTLAWAISGLVFFYYLRFGMPPPDHPSSWFFSDVDSSYFFALLYYGSVWLGALIVILVVEYKWVTPLGPAHSHPAEEQK